MVDGIIIINKEEITVENPKRWLGAFWFLGSIAFLFLSVIGTELEFFVLEVFGLFMVCFWFVLYPSIVTNISNCWETKPLGRYRYIVNISPEVSFTELTEKYDVTKNDDGTYTLEEKEAMSYGETH